VLCRVDDRDFALVFHITVNAVCRTKGRRKLRLSPSAIVLTTLAVFALITVAEFSLWLKT
jgi:hypothetical protein